MRARAIAQFQSDTTANRSARRPLGVEGTFMDARHAQSNTKISTGLAEHPKPQIHGVRPCSLAEKILRKASLSGEPISELASELDVDSLFFWLCLKQ